MQPEQWYMTSRKAALSDVEVIHYDADLELLAAWAGGESVTVRIYSVRTFENVEVFSMAQLEDPSIRTREHVIQSMKNWFTRAKIELEDTEIVDERPELVPSYEQPETEIVE